MGKNKYFWIILLILVSFNISAQMSLSQKADSLYTTGNYIQAINTYSKAGTVKSSLQIARAYNAIGNFEKAVAQYESLVNINPAMEIPQFELGKLYLKTKQYPLAKELFFKLVQKSPKNPEYHFYLGESIREFEDLDLAIPSYKNAVAVDSTHLRSLFQLSKYYLIKREKDSVLYFTNKGLNFYPNDVSLLNFKGLAYFNNDNFRDAIPYFEKLLDLGETKPFVYQKLGYAYFKAWEFEKAKAMYKKAIGMEDNNPELYYELGHVYLKDRALDSAQFYVKKSIEVKKPNLASEYETLAGIARQKDKLSETLVYYTLAHEEQPDEPRYFYQICAMKDGLDKNPKESLDCYQSFLNKYRDPHPYFHEIVSKRISELKTEIHFSQN